MGRGKVPVGLSNRHLHLGHADIETLYGAGYELTNMKDLKQPGQFACNEKVDLVGPKGTIKGVRVLGPARKVSQIEVSISDSFILGVNPPVRDSGDLDGSPGITLVGPCGTVTLEQGVIAAARHIHMHTDDATAFGVSDKELVSVLVEGKRGMQFNNVLVRVHPEYALEFHLDMDEGNAAGLKNGMELEVL